MLKHKNQYGYTLNHTRTDGPAELRFDTKWQRMKYLEGLLKRRAWNKAELARELHVHRCTVGRYIDEMSELCQVQEDEKGKVTIAHKN